MLVYGRLTVWFQVQFAQLLQLSLSLQIGKTRPDVTRTSRCLLWWLVVQNVIFSETVRSTLIRCRWLSSWNCYQLSNYCKNVWYWTKNCNVELPQVKDLVSVKTLISGKQLLNVHVNFAQTAKLMEVRFDAAFHPETAALKAPGSKSGLTSNSIYLPKYRKTGNIGYKIARTSWWFLSCRTILQRFEQAS